MKLALLGCDDEALELIAAAMAGGRHTLVAAYDVAAFQARLRQLAPRARYNDAWESLLVDGQIDAVVVARGKLDPSLESGFSADERRVDQLRKLAQAAVPLLVIHPACEMIVGYELEMIRADIGGVMEPFVPGLHHPAIEELQSLTSDASSPLGEVEQIVLERQMADRSRSAVLTQFARDAALLRRLVGSLRQVAASGPAGSEYQDPLAARVRTLPSLSSLSVHLSGERPFSARWSVGPVDDLAGGKLMIVGSRGRIALLMPEGTASQWELETPGDAGQRHPYQAFDAANDALARLEAAIDERDEHDSAWMDACRDLEAASVIDRSLDKGRAVALYNDEITQEQSFKGVMAVGGCLVLAATLAALMVVVLVEALQLDIRRAPFWRVWPIVLVTPILIFLALQSLRVVAQGRARRTAAASQGAAGSNSAG
jgi:predicted dehydrogenase